MPVKAQILAMLGMQFICLYVKSSVSYNFFKFRAKNESREVSANSREKDNNTLSRSRGAPIANAREPADQAIFPVVMWGVVAEVS